jgi:hypothetical protein
MRVGLNGLSTVTPTKFTSIFVASAGFFPKHLHEPKIFFILMSFPFHPLFFITPLGHHLHLRFLFPFSHLFHLYHRCPLYTICNMSIKKVFDYGTSCHRCHSCHQWHKDKKNIGEFLYLFTAEPAENTKSLENHLLDLRDLGGKQIQIFHWLLAPITPIAPRTSDT